MSDMIPVIAAKSDQINAADLTGSPRTVKIAAVNVSPGTEQPVTINIVGDKKVFRPCKSMSRVMVDAWGPDSSKYVGKSMTLYLDPDVLWAGMKVGGIRISHMSHIDGPRSSVLAENKKNRKLFTVKPLASVADKSAASVPQRGGEAEAPPQDIDAAEVAAEVVAKFRAATDVEGINAAWKMTGADRRACIAEDAAYEAAFLAAFRAAKEALADEVPA
jgi:hypothetical protein